MKSFWKTCIITLFVLFILTSCARPPKVSTTTQEPGDYYFTVASQNEERGYFVHVPTSYSENAPMPLVLNFHGGGGSPEGHMEISKMNAYADTHNFIVVYPRGSRTDGDQNKRLQRFWNYPSGSTGIYNSDPYVGSRDDAEYTSAILDDVEKKFVIDEKRIYATGFSNGAIVVHYIGCALSGRIAAIAPVSGPFWTDPNDCTLTHAMPVLYFQGTGDPCAPYDGGNSECEKGIAGNKRVFPTAESTVKTWKELDGCTDETEVTYQKNTATCTTYTTCKNNAEVTFCKLEGSGHQWPGGKSYSIPGIETGTINNDINANDAMWTFFTNHPLP